MAEKLKGKRIAVVAVDGFEPSELHDPVQAFRESGAECHLISTKQQSIKGWKDGWQAEAKVDKQFKDVSTGDYHALFIPGGTLNCDQLRMDADAVEFVRKMFEEDKPVAAICHGPQLLIEAGVVRGRKMTSYKAIKTDLQNAGADWVDEEVVCDQGLVTSRNPNDLPAFIDKAIEEFVEGKHQGR